MAENVPGPPIRSQTGRSLQYFRKIDDGVKENFYKCLIDDCQKQINGNKQCNLVSHIRVCHRQLYNDAIAPQKNAKYYEQKRLKFVQNCAEFVTINGRPFLSLLDSGFQKIVRDDLEELSANGHGVNIKDTGFKEIKNYIEKIATKIKSEIKVEAKGTFVSLMVDIGRKNDISFLGISVQYIVDGDVKVRSLGMKQLKQAHTAKYIKEVIAECLLIFDITLDQVMSITTDNGSNMLAMINLFNDEDDNDDVEIIENSDNDNNNNTQNGFQNVTAENVCIQRNFVLL